MDYKKILTILILAALAGWAAKIAINRRYQVAETDLPKFDKAHNAPISPPGKENPKPKSAITNLKSAILLPVPFTAQSSDGRWEGIYKEACEEASALMANEYFKGGRSANLDANFALNEIQRLADWETVNFGYNLDINSQETAEMIEKVYGLNAEVVENYTQDDLKKILAENKLILLPANGQKLGNPNYRRPGPPYHMLVIKGYTQTSFITNDPGTKRQWI